MSQVVVNQENSLSSQCLAFCQTLANQGKSFSFNVKVGSDFSFSFSLETSEKDMAIKAKKRITPSTRRRNARRREEFLARKGFNPPSGNAPTSSVEVEKELECDLCDFKSSCKAGLNRHIGSKHKSIPQLDGGMASPKPFENEAVVEVTEAGCQTELEDEQFL